MGSPAHLAHEPLLLDLAAELPKRLLELLGILDDDSHNQKGYLLKLSERGFRVGEAIGVEGGEEQVAAHRQEHQQPHQH
jgi:hypothetical protein